MTGRANWNQLSNDKSRVAGSGGVVPVVARGWVES